jgi:hypothetical protein
MTLPCVSELTIDRLLAGELADPAPAEIRGHAATCATCGGLLRDAEGIVARFAAAPPQLAFPDPYRSRAVGIGAAAAALAAAVALVVWAPWRGEQGGVQTKGRPTIGVFVSHAGVLRRAVSGEVVAPGDRLQLVASNERASGLAVSAVDGSGARTVYAAPQAILAGRDRPLGFSIILDETRGRTAITAMFCAEPFALEQPPDDCTADGFTLEVR